MDEITTRSQEALALYGLSFAEHVVMCSVGYRVNVEPEAIVRHARATSQGDPRGEPSLDELRDGLASCLRRGLLKVLTATDFSPHDGRRMFLRGTPLAKEEGFDNYRPGHVEFTAEGYRVHSDVIARIFGR